jgi:surfeit locus 1 family protein
MAVAAGTGRVRGWAAASLVIIVALVCVRLGFWQLDRLADRRAENRVLLAASMQPAVELTPALAAAIAREPEAYRFRRVRLSGNVPGASDVVLRGRAYEGRPGVHLLAPVVLDGASSAVVLNRGWAPSPDGSTVDPREFSPPPTVHIEGIVHPYPAAEGRGVPLSVELDGYPVFSLSRMDRIALADRAPATLLPFWVQQLDSGNGEANAIPLAIAMPVPDEGNHLSYALQWFGFAGIFLVGLGVMVVRGRSGTTERAPLA